MTDTSPRLALPYLQASQAQKHVTMNDALRQLDALVQMGVEEIGANTPPSSGGDGLLYALGTDAQGDWTGQDGLIAQRRGTGWAFVAPQDGWRVWDRQTGQVHLFTHALGWQPELPELQNLDGVGIGTGSDPVNRLAVASEAALFTHAGSHHRTTLNKATAGDDASHSYQVNWSPRALTGLLGSEDYTVKVSPDGATWHEALSIDHGTGVVSMSQTPAFAARGTAGWTDITTPGTDLTSFDNVFFDQGGNFDPLTGRFTVPINGIYALNVNGFLADTTDARLSFSKNGITLTSEMQVLSGAVPLSMTVLLSLNQGDFVTVRTGNITTLLRYYASHTAFSVWKVA